ncbi:hypothetical protein TRFO_37412 [Tritrichomonas foetus]|uniref:F5/8 type C domain-containing protein n=1 Tax=Tritrichomonas foetus TaxID=1144522 RepID=A0A1J4JDR4_9EUKA|nr:hypothetical protein TRFO_37412 [Tritrichomonas foetus]|eukprot:OHS96431.1 hypothetical protein TRFO_37412 [Tritrichomonas foetus]
MYNFPIDSEVEFVAKHLYEISENDECHLKELSLDILIQILSHPSLCIESESWLLAFIIKMTRINEKYSLLYEYLEFDEMSSDDIELFIDSFQLSSINYGIWKSLCKRLISPPNSPLNSPFASKSSSISSFASYEPSSSLLLSQTKGRYKSLSRCQSVDSVAQMNNSLFQQDQNRFENVASFEFSENEGNSLNGVFAYLSSTIENGNIKEAGLIDITSSSAVTIGDLANIVDRDSEMYSYTSNDPDSWIQIDFKNFRLTPTFYSIRTENNPSGYDHMRSWVLEGSEDGHAWTELDRREENGVLNSASAIGHFSIQNSMIAKFLRVRQIGTNWAERNYLSMSNIEFFGNLVRTSA